MAIGPNLKLDVDVDDVQRVYDRLVSCPVCRQRAFHELCEGGSMRCLDCGTSMPVSAYLSLKDRQLRARRESFVDTREGPSE